MRLKGTRDNFKIHVNFMKPTFLCSLRQGEANDKKVKYVIVCYFSRYNTLKIMELN